MVMLLCSRAKILINFLYFFAVIPFVSTVFRNIIFIRCATDFLPFIGLTTYMLLLFLIYRRCMNFGFLSSILLFASALIAVSAKASAVFAALCLLFALAVTAMISNTNFILKLNSFDNKIRFFLKSLIVSLCLIGGAIAVCALLLRNTPVYELLIKTYIGPLFKAFLLTQKLDHLYFESSFVGPVHTKGHFFITSVFAYSPVLSAGFFYALYQIYKKFKIGHKAPGFDFFIFVWFALGIFGILNIMPDAKYTSPFAFGLIYLVFRGFDLSGDTAIAKMYILSCLLFGATEVLLVSIA